MEGLLVHNNICIAVTEKLVPSVVAEEDAYDLIVQRLLQKHHAFINTMPEISVAGLRRACGES